MKTIFTIFGLLMSIVNLNQHLNPNHLDLFQTKAREVLVRGGANAGKSYSIADKLHVQGIRQGDKKLTALVIKQTQPSLRDTVIDILVKRAETFKLPFKVNLNTLTAQCGNMRFLFRSMHNQEDYKKIKSYTDIDFVWINEITELREEDYRMIKSRLRGGQGDFAQIISDFNPVGKTSWVYDRFYSRNVGNAVKLKYTVEDNPWASPDEIADLRNTKDDDPNYYKIYFLGEWGELEGVIYNWRTETLPDPEDVDWDEVFYGLDFGYSVDPAAVVRIYRKADEYWVQELIYETGLTNTQLGERMKSHLIQSHETIYADSAEPKSIQELCDMGFNVHPSLKGADSVRAGIDFVRQQNITVATGSPNILKEQKSYIWKKDKDGNALNVPIDINNHAMDAIRYGVYTHAKRGGQGEVVFFG